MPIQARRFPHRRGDTVPGAKAQRRNCLLHQVIGVPCQKVMARLYPARITDSLARLHSIRTGSSMARRLPARITDSLARLHSIRTLSSMARMLPHPHKRLDGPTPTRCPSSFRCAEPTNWPDCFPLPLHTQGAAEHSELQENQQTQTSNIITNTSSATQR